MLVLCPKTLVLYFIKSPKMLVLCPKMLVLYFIKSPKMLVLFRPLSAQYLAIVALFLIQKQKPVWITHQL